MKNKLIFFTLLLLFSCHADKIVIDECIPIPKDNSLDRLNYADVQEVSPCFNPNDPNEFVYCSYTQITTLKTYNLQTKVSLEFAKDGLVPQWGKNGLIVFEGFPNLYTIRADGTDKKLLKTPLNTRVRHFSWKNDSVIAADCMVGFPSLYAEFKVDGTIVDTFRNLVWREGKWNNQGEFAYFSLPDWSIYLKNGKKDELLYLSNPAHGGITTIVSGMDWSSDGETLYFTLQAGGIFKVNKRTKVVTRLKEGCYSRQYSNISVSSDNKKILVQRQDASDFDNKSKISLDNGIYIMDIDGSNERKINFQ
jgi:hypothetical protein